MNKRQRKKNVKKFFGSDAFKDFGKAMIKDFYFKSETPILNTLLGKEPYQYRDIWDKHD